MSEERDDDYADYYRKGVPLYSPEMLLLLMMVVTVFTLFAAIVTWIG